jgi:hypothetical protein
MIGSTLDDARTTITRLASDDGDYVLRCARHGDRPVPATDLRFETRAVGRIAARAVEHYRAALRRYDPQLPHYDVVVHQTAGVDPTRERDGPADTPTAGPTADRPPHAALVEFCHRVAAAVFETLAASNHDGVETATMDAYFELAETHAEPDALCLRLLESMATELVERLSPVEQAAVLADAARRLGAVDRPISPDPLEATMDRLRRAGVVAAYDDPQWSLSSNADTRTVHVDLTDYVLSPHDGRLPTLPVVVECYRRFDAWEPTRLEAVDGDGDDWRLSLSFARDGDPDALATAPIGPTDD